MKKSANLRRTKQTIQSLADTKSLRPVNTATGSDQSPTLHGFVTSPSSSTASAFGQSTDCLTTEQVASLNKYQDDYEAAYLDSKFFGRLSSELLP